MQCDGELAKTNKCKPLIRLISLFKVAIAAANNCADKEAMRFVRSSK